MFLDDGKFTCNVFEEAIDGPDVGLRYIKSSVSLQLLSQL